MKKILATIITSLLVISLSACSSGSKVNYTYKWTEPAFSSASTTKDFGDFKISYPTNLSVTKSISIEEAQKGNGVFYTSMAPIGNTNLNILFKTGKFKITDIDETMVKSAAKSAGDGMGVEVKYDSVEYASVYKKDMAFSYMNTIYNGFNISFIQQYVPTDKGLYIFTYTIVNNQGIEDIKAMANSVTFK